MTWNTENNKAATDELSGVIMPEIAWTGQADCPSPSSEARTAPEIRGSDITPIIGHE
jgi:hypothetical protein